MANFDFFDEIVKAKNSVAEEKQKEKESGGSPNFWSRLRTSLFSVTTVNGNTYDTSKEEDMQKLYQEDEQYKEANPTLPPYEGAVIQKPKSGSATLMDKINESQLQTFDKQVKQHVDFDKRVGTERWKKYTEKLLESNADKILETLEANPDLKYTEADYNRVAESRDTRKNAILELGKSIIESEKAYNTKIVGDALMGKWPNYPEMGEAEGLGKSINYLEDKKKANGGLKEGLKEMFEEGGKPPAFSDVEYLGTRGYLATDETGQADFLELFKTYAQTLEDIKIATSYSKKETEEERKTEKFRLESAKQAILDKIDNPEPEKDIFQRTTKEDVKNKPNLNALVEIEKGIEDLEKYESIPEGTFGTVASRVAVAQQSMKQEAERYSNMFFSKVAPVIGEVVEKKYNELQELVNAGTLSVEDANKQLTEVYAERDRVIKTYEDNVYIELERKWNTAMEQVREDAKVPYSDAVLRALLRKKGLLDKKYQYDFREDIREGSWVGGTYRELDLRLSRGSATVVGSLGGLAAYYGYYELARQANKYKEVIHETYPLPTGTAGGEDFTIANVFEKDWFMEKIVENLPMTLSMMAPALIVGGATAGIAAGAGLSAFGSSFAGAIAGTLVSAPMETGLEMGEVHNDIFQKTGSLEQAAIGTSYVGRVNLLVKMGDVVQLTGLFLPAPKAASMLLKLGIIGAKGAWMGVTEGFFEEFFQEGASRIANDAVRAARGEITYDEAVKTYFQWWGMPEANESMATGAINAWAFGMAHASVAQAQSYSKTWDTKTAAEGLLELILKGVEVGVNEEGMVVPLEGINYLNKKAKNLANSIGQQQALGQITQDQATKMLALLQQMKDFAPLVATKDAPTQSQVANILNEIMLLDEQIKETEGTDASAVLQDQRKQFEAQLTEVMDKTAPGYFINNVYFDKDTFLKALDAALENKLIIEVRNDPEVETMVLQQRESRKKSGLPYSENVIIKTTEEQLGLKKTEASEKITKSETQILADEAMVEQIAQAHYQDVLKKKAKREQLLAEQGYTDEQIAADEEIMGLETEIYYAKNDVEKTRLARIEAEKEGDITSKGKKPTIPTKVPVSKPLERGAKSVKPPTGATMEPKNKEELKAGLASFDKFSEKEIDTFANLYDRIARSYAKAKGITVVEAYPMITSQYNLLDNVDDMGEALQQVAGERGAKNLDEAQETTVRMDNLGIANEMETAGKDAKTIRMATGWEKGVDGKWRYEIPDVKLKKRIGDEIYDKSLKGMYGVIGSAERGSIEGGNLKEYIEANELFKAYPALKKLSIYWDTKHRKGFEVVNVELAVYFSQDETIILNPFVLKNYTHEQIQSILAHEIQHAIQDIEGFAKGGNAESIYSIFEDQLRGLLSLIKNNEEFVNKYGWEKAEELFGLDRTAHEADKILAKRLSEELTKGLAFGKIDLYRRLAGEVEPRNVGQRMNMTSEQRKETLLEETEDVPRKDQLVTDIGLKSDRNKLSTKPELDAVQKQGAAEVSVQPKTRSGEKVSPTQPEAKPEKPTAEKGKRKVRKDTDVELFQEQKGRASFYEDAATGKHITNLTKASDITSLIHELGHGFLQRMIKDAKKGMDFANKYMGNYLSEFNKHQPKVYEYTKRLNDAIVAGDVALEAKIRDEAYVNEKITTTNFTIALNHYFGYDVREGTFSGKQREFSQIGLDNLSEGENYTMAHEFFAEGWEAWVYQGNQKTDNKKLQQIFEALRDYFVAIYNSIASYSKRSLTPQMRSLYETMVGLKPYEGGSQHIHINQNYGVEEAITEKIFTEEEAQLFQPDVTGVGERFYSTEYFPNENAVIAPKSRPSGMKDYVKHLPVVADRIRLERLLYQELTPKTIEVDGKDRPTMNSNGQPIHNTKEGIVNFWKWFGDSQVVDEQGRPLTVYHGTTQNFPDFKKEKLGSKNVFAESAYEGFFFAKSPITAENYTTDLANLQMGAFLENPQIIKSVEKVRPKYQARRDAIKAEIDAINVKEQAELKKFTNEIFGIISKGLSKDQIERLQFTAMDFPKNKEIIAKYDELRSNPLDRLAQLNMEEAQEIELEYNAENDRGASIMPVYLSVQKIKEFDFGGEEKAAAKFTDIIKQAKKEGKDGVVLQNVRDGADIYDNIYIVFEPNQIKSSIGNIGAFSKQDNNILFQEPYSEKKLLDQDNGYDDLIHISKEGDNIIYREGFTKNTFDGLKVGQSHLTNDELVERFSYNIAKMAAASNMEMTGYEFKKKQGGKGVFEAKMKVLAQEDLNEAISNNDVLSDSKVHDFEAALHMAKKGSSTTNIAALTGWRVADDGMWRYTPSTMGVNVNIDKLNNIEDGALITPKDVIGNHSVLKTLPMLSEVEFVFDKKKYEGLSQTETNLMFVADMRKGLFEESLSQLEETEDIPREDQIIVGTSVRDIIAKESIIRQEMDASEDIINNMPTGAYTSLGNNTGINLQVLGEVNKKQESLYQEKIPKTINFNGKIKPTSNSLGKPIHSTKSGIINFWKWFGDSKVVDEQGRPLVVFRGIHNEEFGIWTDRQYFSESVYVPRDYLFDYPQKIFAVYLKGENILDLDVVNEVLTSKYGVSPSDKFAIHWSTFRLRKDGSFSHNDYLRSVLKDLENRGHKKFVDNLIEKIHNADIIKGRDIGKPDYPPTYVTKSPSQIKSANIRGWRGAKYIPSDMLSKEENVGAFSSKSDNVLYQTTQDFIPDTWDIDRLPNGDYVFYHYGEKNIDIIDPKFFGKNMLRTTDKRSNNVSFLYTKENQKERMVSGSAYVVRVDRNKVYPFNIDPLNLYDLALEKFNEQKRKGYIHPNAVFDAVHQIDYMNPIAVEYGFDMVVAIWQGGFRAETSKAIAIDKALTEKFRSEGTVIGKKDVPLYQSTIEEYNLQDKVVGRRMDGSPIFDVAQNNPSIKTDIYGHYVGNKTNDRTVDINKTPSNTNVMLSPYDVYDTYRDPLGIVDALHNKYPGDVFKILDETIKVLKSLGFKGDMSTDSNAFTYVNMYDDVKTTDKIHLGNKVLSQDAVENDPLSHTERLRLDEAIRQLEEKLSEVSINSKERTQKMEESLTLLSNLVVMNAAIVNKIGQSLTRSLRTSIAHLHSFKNLESMVESLKGRVDSKVYTHIKDVLANMKKVQEATKKAKGKGDISRTWMDRYGMLYAEAEKQAHSNSIREKLPEAFSILRGAMNDAVERSIKARIEGLKDVMQKTLASEAAKETDRIIEEIRSKFKGKGLNKLSDKDRVFIGKIEDRLFPEGGVPMTREQANELVDKIYTEAEEQERDLTTEEQEEVFLTRFSDISEMVPKELQIILEEVKGVVELGREHVRARVEAQKEAVAKRRVEAWVAISGGMYDMHKDPVSVTADQSWAEKWTAITHSSQYTNRSRFPGLKKYNLKHLNLFHLLDRITINDAGYAAMNHPWVKDIGKMYGRSEAATINGVVEANMAIRTAAMDIFGVNKENDLIQIFRYMKEEHPFKYTTRGDKLVPYKNMTLGKAIKKYMELQDESLHATFERDTAIKNINTFQAELLGYIFKHDTKESVTRGRTLDWADWQLKFYADYPYQNYGGNSLVDVYYDVYGAGFPLRGSYSPIYREAEVSSSSTSSLDEMAAVRKESGYASAKSRYFKPRKNATQSLLFVDANEVLLDYVSKTEFFKGHAQSVKHFNSLFNNKDIQKLIANNYGSEYVSAIKETLKAMTNNTSRWENRSKWLDRLRSSTTKSWLAVNIPVFFKQLSSIPAYIAFANRTGNENIFKVDARYFKYFVEGIVTGKAFGKLLTDNPYMQERYRVGMDVNEMLALKRNVGSTIAGQRRVRDILMIPMKLGDKGAILVGGYPIYKMHYDALTKSGTDHKMAHKLALEEFILATRLSQQSGGNFDLSYYQRSGSWNEAFMMFSTAPLSYHRMAFAAARRVIRDVAHLERPRAFDVQTIILSHILLPTIFQIISNGFRWDWEDQKRAAVLGQLNSLFIAGTVLEWGLSGLTSTPLWKGGSNLTLTPLSEVAKSLEDVSSRLLQVIDDYKWDIDTPVEQWTILGEKVFQLVALSTGLPLMLGRYTKNYYDIGRNEVGYDLPDLLAKGAGFSDYMLGFYKSQSIASYVRYRESQTASYEAIAFRRAAAEFTEDMKSKGVDWKDYIDHVGIIPMAQAMVLLGVDEESVANYKKGAQEKIKELTNRSGSNIAAIMNKFDPQVIIDQLRKEDKFAFPDVDDAYILTTILNEATAIVLQAMGTQALKVYAKENGISDRIVQDVMSNVMTARQAERKNEEFGGLKSIIQLYAKGMSKKQTREFLMLTEFIFEQDLHPRLRKPMSFKEPFKALDMVKRLKAEILEEEEKK